MKQNKNESVLHDWIGELPFTQQAVLLLSLRGPDGLPKQTCAKVILHYLRGVIIKPAYPDFSGYDGFMNTDYERFDERVKGFFYSVDEFPHHFLMHLVHAAEIIAYNHPEADRRVAWGHFYRLACKGLHMNMETIEQLNARLCH